MLVVRRFVSSWESVYTAVKLYLVESWVCLVAVSGNRKQGFTIPREHFADLAAAVWGAATDYFPEPSLAGSLPLCMVDGGNRTITISWQPRRTGKTSDLVIEKGDKAIVVPQGRVHQFARWLQQQAYALSSDFAD